MNNKTVLLISFIITYLLSAINPIYCQDYAPVFNEQTTKYSFSLGTGFGFIYGNTFEFVYPVETKGELLSELIWEMKPVYYVGFNADLGLTDLLSSPGFFSSLAIKAGIPADSGVLEDRDWLSTVNGDLTRFSSHTNRTDELIWIDLTVGASFPIKFFYIKPFISGSWMRFLFAGRDGHGIYNDWNPKEQDFSGEQCITYQQDWLLLAAGFSIGTNILAPFSIDLSFQISPFTYCSATDHHILTDTFYRDITNFGLFLEPGCSISLDIKKIKFSLEAYYRYISRTEGESYTSEDNKKFHLGQNKAGAGLAVMDFQFLIKLKF
jgi:outer membrane protease